MEFDVSRDPPLFVTLTLVRPIQHRMNREQHSVLAHTVQFDDAEIDKTASWSPTFAPADISRRALARQNRKR